MNFYQKYSKANGSNWSRPCKTNNNYNYNLNLLSFNLPILKDLIFSKLKGIKAFEQFHPMLIQQLCYYGYYESIDKGVTCIIKLITLSKMS